MRKFLLASHGTLAQGMLDAVTLILGKLPNVGVMCAYSQQGYDLTKEIESVISSLDDGDELIVITDFFGGSVNNEWMRHLSGGHIYLVAGMNLCMLLELFCSKEGVEQAIGQAITLSTTNMRYCNPLISATVENDKF
ncbi:PTS sugar transporter subunit IIA [Caproiciproducens sp. CPB-2]|uniref:PTS sugar transporter subunit IIA n=1 Tax=Caproiciproducens sp. CPB-2 TaxID=3030017 RepID=UPI0023DA1724|nr:PTS sugar transporter [Caproiciproducens sp. CPB-2]MDF1494544.1 PTS sugar transporter [Caproiciproducens sp. CPB-2]